MSEYPPFTKSERAAGECLSRLKFYVGAAHNRNEKGEIKELDLHDAAYDTEAIRAVADLKGLQRFSVSGPFACDLLLEALARSPCLEEIILHDASAVTDSGASHLIHAPKLWRLEIRESKISDAGAKAIGQIRSLKWLHIDCGDLITNDGLCYLAELPKLHSLDVSGPLIDDNGLAHLAQHKELTCLSLERTKVRGVGCAHLRTVKKLKYLAANESSFDDEGLAALAGLQKLEDLMLRSTRVTDKGIPHLAKISRLTEVDLCGCTITDASVPAFARCAKLKSLYLVDTPVTSDGRKDLKNKLPKCTIHISDGADEPEEDAPWQDPKYFWKHPPECLARFKLTKKRGDDLEEWDTRFQLACPCGHRKGEALGYALSRVAAGEKLTAAEGKMFVGPLSFCCDKCQAVTKIIDTDDDGFNGRSGNSSVYRGKGKPDKFTCPNCKGTIWQLLATVQMDEAAFELWNDDPDIALENYFDAFHLEGTCAKCKEAETIAEFELA